MIAFWIVIVALLALVSLTLALPLLRGESRQTISRSALNKQLYRQRVVEIGEERDQGILAEEQESLVELQRSLLDDIPDVEQTASAGRSLVWIPGVLVLVVVSLALYAKLGAWQEVMHWQSVNARLPELSNKILVERDSDVTEQDLQEFMLGLRTRLAEEPGDYRGWLLLGRLALDGNDPDTALGSLERAYQMAPEKRLVTVPYAQALMMNGDEVKADALLQQAIARDPQDLEARSTYAFMALQKEDFKTALSRWQAMLPLMEKGSSRYQMIERSIEYAEQQLAKSGGQLAPSAASGDPQGEVSLAVKAGEFPIHITLAPGIQMPDDPHLFVFAVVPNGPPMPIAVKRIRDPKLPVTLSLGDGDAMIEGSKLEVNPELQFKARLSAGGNVMNKEGAFEGVSTTVSTATIPTVPIDIRIDRAL
ncbi:c-type cytochrome biogenesis protein CcmI [Aeromonas rivuli]|uniref:c-type cytochrome biogenesis protein CcmI n=2 Tax=Aeromonas TaxID=642 RepID=UPI002168C4DC|nr:c-type cytochrome biogenesis protein CcmI [Aeromonas sp. BIGb0405]MCS3455363.1 cytochrome c-type biogenesis protein CcmI [Aeromonas sp. BIGb0405]